MTIGAGVKVGGAMVGSGRGVKLPIFGGGVGVLTPPLPLPPPPPTFPPPPGASGSSSMIEGWGEGAAEMPVRSKRLPGRSRWICCIMRVQIVTEGLPPRRRGRGISKPNQTPATKYGV